MVEETELWAGETKEMRMVMSKRASDVHLDAAASTTHKSGGTFSPEGLPVSNEKEHHGFGHFIFSQGLRICSPKSF